MMQKKRYDLDILVLYALRLSLERRILGFLGIDFIISNEKPVGLSKLLKIVKKLDNVIYKDEIDWDKIEVVNNWINHHMHRHLRPYPWVIHQAFEVVDPLLEKSKVIDGNTIHYSIHASTFVHDEEAFHAEIEERINAEMPNVYIAWKANKDILKRKYQ